jgi:hypothetical protein
MYDREFIEWLVYALLGAMALAAHTVLVASR